MQNYTSLNIDYTNFNQSGGSFRGDGEAGGGIGDGSAGGEKGEKNRKSGEIIYKTIILPFNIPIIDYVIENNLFIEIVDNINNNQIIGQGKIRKYRFNGLLTDCDIFVEMDNENVYHVKKRGIMMRIRIEEDQYKIIIDLLKSINIVKISGGGGGGGGGSGRNALNKKKKGFFSCFACFKAV
jgi:hypothetical protein